MKNTITCFLLLWSAILLTAQTTEYTPDTITTKRYATWELGVLLGGANAYGDMIDPNFSSISITNLAYGAFIRKSATRNLGLRLNVLRGKISGDDADYDDLRGRGISFTSNVTELSLVADWDFRGKRRFSDRGHFDKTFSPYVFAGIGAAFADTETDYSAAPPSFATRIQQDVDNERSTHFTVPFGAGVKVDLSRNLVLGAEFGLRPVFNDLLDGVSAAGNPEEDDWYSIGNLTLSYRLGIKDSDQDGIVDSEDACPDRKGLPEFAGCPDSDQDGIMDKEDKCPTVFGFSSTDGCPDADRDGIIDSKDSCPNEAGLAQLDGCPDMDKDGIADRDDKCPEVPGTPELGGCRDSDNDGIIDEEDDCPYLKGLAAYKGCPSTDRDNDGVPNEADACPDVAGVLNGCPDRDNDGIADKDDDCPDVAGPSSNIGCPVLKQEDRDILNIAIKDVRFKTASYELLSSSYPVLNQIADIMKRYPNYNLAIEGYTDNRGNDFANQQLSQYRARACYNFLANKGVAKTRMTFKGYGEIKPIGDNSTDAGRRLNRRVEFKLAPR